MYSVATPMSLRTYSDLESAKAAILKGCPALKRGWTTEWVEHSEGHIQFRVLNSKGRLMTGAMITPRDEKEK